MMCPSLCDVLSWPGPCVYNGKGAPPLSPSIWTHFCCPNAFCALRFTGVVQWLVAPLGRDEKSEECRINNHFPLLWQAYFFSLSVHQFTTLGRKKTQSYHGWHSAAWISHRHRTHSNTHQDKEGTWLMKQMVPSFTLYTLCSLWLSFLWLFLLPLAVYRQWVFWFALVWFCFLWTVGVPVIIWAFTSVWKAPTEPLGTTDLRFGGSTYSQQLTIHPYWSQCFNTNSS